MQPSISLLPFPVAHTVRTIAVKQREARLITENKVPPVPEVLPFVRFASHTMTSPVIQSLSGTLGWTPKPIVSSLKPVYNGPNWQTPLTPVYLYVQTSWDKMIVPNHSNQVFVFLRCDLTPPTSTPTFMWRILWPTSVSVALQNFVDASWRYKQHSCHFSLKMSLSWQFCNMHQNWLLRTTRYGASKNEKWCSKKHTHYWTINLLAKHHQNWQQLGLSTFQSVPTLHCLD